MELKPGFKIGSKILNAWWPALGLPDGMYPVGVVNPDYFTVMMKGFMPVPVRLKGFVEFYQQQVKSEMAMIEEKGRELVLHGDAKNGYYVTPVPDYPIPNYQHGAYIGVDFGNTGDSFTIMTDAYGVEVFRTNEQTGKGLSEALKKVIDNQLSKNEKISKTSRIEQAIVNAALQTARNSVGNYEQNLQNTINGKTINIPRTVAAIERGERIRGTAIKVRTGRTTIATRHPRNKKGNHCSSKGIVFE